MATITTKGRELACNLNQGTTRDILENCSLLCRAATSYAKVQEGHCNGHPAMGSPTIPIERANKLQATFEKHLEKREEQLEKRIKYLAGQLPGVHAVKFGGDPRGATVKLVMENGRTDDWGQEGLCVPGA